MIKSIPILLLLLVSACEQHDEAYSIVRIPENLINSRNMWGPDDRKHLREFSMEGVNCYIPDQEPHDELFCVDGKEIIFSYLRGEKKALMVMHSGGPNFIIIDDLNGDGSFDAIKYDGVNENGELIRLVEDKDLDGVLEESHEIRNSK